MTSPSNFVNEVFRNLHISLYKLEESDDTKAASSTVVLTYSRKSYSGYNVFLGDELDKLILAGLAKQNYLIHVVTQLDVTAPIVREEFFSRLPSFLSSRVDLYLNPYRRPVSLPVVELMSDLRNCNRVSLPQKIVLDIPENFLVDNDIYFLTP